VLATSGEPGGSRPPETYLTLSVDFLTDPQMPVRQASGPVRADGADRRKPSEGPGEGTHPGGTVLNRGVEGSRVVADQRADRLDQLPLAHRLVGGPSRGRRWRTAG
jgi:hypothetical protein